MTTGRTVHGTTTTASSHKLPIKPATIRPSQASTGRESVNLGAASGRVEDSGVNSAVCEAGGYLRVSGGEHELTRATQPRPRGRHPAPPDPR